MADWITGKRQHQMARIAERARGKGAWALSRNLEKAGTFHLPAWLGN